MRWWFLALMTLMGGCSEYDIRGDDDDPPVLHQPPPVEPGTVHDRIVQQNINKMDVLFVIDNSCSMYDKQTTLVANVPIFLDYFVGTSHDYHVGVVSTDMYRPEHSGQLQYGGGYPYIDRFTINPHGVFAQMALMGTGGYGQERGRDAAYTALELLANSQLPPPPPSKDTGDTADTGDTGPTPEFPHHRDFYRKSDPSVDLHLIFISDEPDQSSIISKDEFIEWMRNQKPLGNVYASSIVNTVQCNEEVALQYIEYATATGGEVSPICAPDWADIMERLGLLATGMPREFFLSDLPVPETIEVKVFDDPVTLTFEGPWDITDTGTPPDWIYLPGRNSIVFLEFTPGPLSEILIDYTKASDAQPDD